MLRGDEGRLTRDEAVRGIVVGFWEMWFAEII